MPVATAAPLVSSAPARWLLAVLGGVATFVAFPGWNIHPLVWVCQVPLLVACAGLGAGAAFRLGLLAGFVTNFGGFHWITYMLGEFGHLPAPVSWAILALQALTQGLTSAVGAALWRFLAQRGAHEGLAAWLALWAGEAAVPMIFPWFLANAASPQLPVIQIADLGGVHLVSALLYAANAWLALVIIRLLRGQPFPWRMGLAVGLFVATSVGYGYLRIAQVDAEDATSDKLKLGLVEGNVGIWEKEARHLSPRERILTLRHNLLKHQQMTAQLQAQGAELVVWPESSYIPFGPVPVLHSAADALIAGAGGALLQLQDGQLRPLALDRLGLPRDVGLLSALSWPRGDVWRALDGGKRVLTVTPAGTEVTPLPEGVVGVAVVQPPPDWRGTLPTGIVVGQHAEQFLLPLPPMESAGQTGTPAQPSPLQRVAEARALPPVDLTAAAVNGEGAVVGCGRDGALVFFGELGARPLKSPVTSHLWAIAGEPGGSGFVAVGDAGNVVSGDGARFTSETLGNGALYAAWYGPAGRRWVAGQGGAVWTQAPESSWKRIAGLPAVDWVAGTATWRGEAVLVGRDGRVVLLSGDPVQPKVQEVGRDARALTVAVGSQPVAASILPRNAARIVPAQTPLPDPSLAFPANVESDAALTELERSTPLRGFDVPLLMGALTQGKQSPEGNARCTDCYNSAVLLGKEGKLDALTDKSFLLVFGEYIPFGDEFPVLYDWLPEASQFQAGTRTEPLRFARPGKPDARLGILVCYEDLLPSFARRVAIHDPDVLINLTNDAWFGQTAEPEHHLNLALLRSVEYRRWLVRSTNTGISVFIDAVGRRVQETSLQDAETMLREVPLRKGRTVYATLGNWPLWALGLGLLVLLAGALRAGPGPAPAVAKATRKAPRRKAKPPAAT